MSAHYQAPTVKKAFHILRLISRRDMGVRLSELAKELDIGKSTVHGILSALEAVGAVARDPETKRYTLGLTLLELGGAAHALIALKEIAHPEMQALMEQSQESVFLGVKNGDRVTIIDIVESGHDLKITSPIGTTIPLLAGATGKVFLSQLDEDQVAGILANRPIPRFTPYSVCDPHQLQQAAEAARRNGFAVDDEEYISGVRAVAAPIHTNGHQQAAIWVVGFKTSLTDTKMQALTSRTKAAAEAIGRQFMNTTAAV